MTLRKKSSNTYKLTFNVSTGVLPDFLIYRNVLASNLESALVMGNEASDYMSSLHVCFAHIATEQLDNLVEEQFQSDYYQD